MKIQTGKFKGFAVIIASLAVLLAVSVLAVTVYAVTLENAGISPVAASVGGLVGDGGSQSHTITVNAAYADAVSGETQTVELYADGATDTATDSGALADRGTVTFTTADATPSLNLKSSAKVSVSSVQIMDGETDVTIDQFGGQTYYDNFIESCKTSLFGYFELQSVAGDLTVNVEYGEPVTVSSNNYSATIVTKGYAGPIRNISRGDYQAVEFYSLSYPSIDSDGNLSGDYGYEYKTSTSASEYHMTEGGQLTRYVSGPRDYYLDMNNYSCIESVKLYDNSTGDLIPSDFSDITGEKVSCRQVLNYSPADSNDPTDITIVVTYKKAARIVGYKVSSCNAHDEAYYIPIYLSSENGSDGIFFTGGDDSYLYSSSSGYENTELTTATGFSNSTLKLYHHKVNYRRYMRKIIFLMITVFAAAVCLQQTAVSAAAEFSDGIYTFKKTEHGTAVITDCNLTDEEINVPYNVLDYPVVGIGDYAFFSNRYIKNVNLPSGVMSIGEFSFANNPGLESVTIPKRCNEIADNAFWKSPDAVIRCWYDSAAFSYAQNNEIPCVLLDDAVAGDVNGDGSITIGDVTDIQRNIADLEVLDGLHLLAADVNRDGEVDITDATDIQLHLAGYDTSYPIGEPIERNFPNS